MMNPARRLHEIFSTWADKYNGGVSAYNARGFEQGDADAVAVPLHVEMFRLLVSLDHSLDYLERTRGGMEVYRENYGAWVRMAMHAPNSWTSVTSAAQGFPSEPLAHLRTLGTLLDWDNPGLMPEPKERLRDAIAEVLGLLLEDETLSNSLRAYLYKLTQEIGIALDDESVMGTFDFASAAERLWIAMYAAAGQSRRPKKWREAAAHFLRDSGVAAVGSLPAVGLTLLQLQQAVS